MFHQDSRQLYRVSEFDRLEWLEHGFGTRASGYWVRTNLVKLRQMHSHVCLCVDRAPGAPLAGDALLSATPGLLLGIRTADCLPILIADPRHKAVAAVHAGWRGSALGVAAKAVQALALHFSSRPEDLQAALGPGICGRCYMVGPEVARSFGAWFPELAEASGPTHLDLVEVNRRQLIQAGLPPQCIYQGAPCTACTPAEFYSYRRDRSESGRMLSVIGVRPR